MTETGEDTSIDTLLDEETINAAVLYLSGDTLAWYRWSNQRKVLNTWEVLKELFLNRFRLIHGGDLYKQWAALKPKNRVKPRDFSLRDSDKDVIPDKATEFHFRMERWVPFLKGQEEMIRSRGITVITQIMYVAEIVEQ
ncbi:unnamed protein product [Lactuca saligna]|uniref:Retrotransposon gag domain-containing protein n=1 Tax=Lactuca saligna TaxID=75948 RepID=A0AA36A263_LACSI|nr:unnamed protein product [Lactuca saligna]